MPFKELFNATSDDGRDFAMRYVEATLIAGVVTVPDVGLDWYPIGMARLAGAVGTPGQATATIDGAGDLIVQSDNALDVSTFRVLLGHGGGPRVSYAPGPNVVYRTKNMYTGVGKDGRAFELRYVEAVLFEGSITVPDAFILNGETWYPIALVRRLPGAGALGNLSASEGAGGTLVIDSDAATDASTVVVLFARGGSPDGILLTDLGANAPVKRMFRSRGKDGRAFELSFVQATLVAGATTVVDGAGGATSDWQPIGDVRVSAGAGALGLVTVGDVAGDLELNSSAATDVSTMRTLLMRGGPPAVAAL